MQQDILLDLMQKDIVPDLCKTHGHQDPDGHGHQDPDGYGHQDSDEHGYQDPKDLPV